MISKAKETQQLKQRLGQGRAGIRCKKPQITHPIAQSEKWPVKILEIPTTQNIVTTITSFATPVKSRDDSHLKVIDRKTYRMQIKKFLSTQI